MADPVARVLEADAIRSRVSELGAEIAEDFAGRTPVLVGILAGAVPFLADLVRAMAIDAEVDFMALTRFGEGGRVSVAYDTDTSLTGRHIIIVEDIVDTGLTLTALRHLLETRSPAGISTATLFDKVTRRLVDVPLEYRGFEVGDEFLVGYGLDFEGRYRNLPDVWAVLDLGEFTGEPDQFGGGVFGDAGDNLMP